MRINTTSASLVSFALAGVENNPMSRRRAGSETRMGDDLKRNVKEENVRAERREVDQGFGEKLRLAEEEHDRKNKDGVDSSLGQ